MALGRRKPVQQPLFVTTAALNVRANPFYESVNQVLAAHHFDPFAEGLCAKFYDDGAQGGRPGLAPGIYFRCLLVGYFEGIDSERGIDWRCNDSISLKLFLGVALIHAAGFNIGLMMRVRYGMRKPRSGSGVVCALIWALVNRVQPLAALRQTFGAIDRLFAAASQTSPLAIAA